MRHTNLYTWQTPGKLRCLNIRSPMPTRRATSKLMANYWRKCSWRFHDHAPLANSCRTPGELLTNELLANLWQTACDSAHGGFQIATRGKLPANSWRTPGELLANMFLEILETRAPRIPGENNMASPETRKLPANSWQTPGEPLRTS